MLIYFSDLIKENSTITKQFAKLFNDTFLLKTNSILGTLSNPVNEEYDLMLTNPPYVTSGSSNLKEEIRKSGLENHYSINAMGVEGLFMEWIIRALKPNGKAFIVIPDGILNRQHDKKLRKFILNECYIDAIISLPPKTFFTTIKKTYILAITKKNNKTNNQKTPVFTYLVNEIGETLDIYRFDIEKNHLDDAVNLYNQFKGAKSHFKTDDKRCKIQNIKKFTDTDNVDQSWIIDKWWNEDEKIELGIIEESEKLDLDEFSILLGEVSDTINEYRTLLKELSGKKNFNLKQKEVLIEDILDSPPTNSGLKKSDVFLIERNDTIPVYSASKDENSILGWVDKKSKWKKYKNVLTWNKDGSSGRVFYRKKEFVPYEKVKVLKIKKLYKDFLYYDFLRIIIEKKLLDLKFNFNFKCSMERVLKVKILIPINENGEFDINTQKEIINKSAFINEFKNKIDFYKEKIKNIKINIIGKSNINKKKIPIDDIFKIIKGKAKYTRKYIKNNTGVYPVYSSQTTNDGIIGKINSYDFDIECLTWTTDGAYAGTVFYRNEKFSMTTHCGALILKEMYKNSIDLNFVHFYLFNNLKKYAQGESNKRITVNTIKNIIIQIPILANGLFDLQTQKEIAQKYQTIKQIKQQLIDYLTNIIKTEVVF